MAASQNGWTALEPDSKYLYTWTIPAKNGHLKLKLHRGCAGFLLVHFLLWFSERVEDLTGGIMDDWGYAYRDVRGQMKDLSNHASGTAADANATKHPMGLRGTFKSAWQYARIRARLVMYLGCIRWGGDYRYRADEMHFEINRGYRPCRALARKLAKTPRGKRILAANPSQRRFVL